MKIDLSKFAKEVQLMISAALDNDGKISLNEMREMKLAKDVELQLMTLLSGNPDMIGDGFVKKTTADGSTILSAGELYQGVKWMSEDEKRNYRTRYNNNEIEEGFLEDGVLYFRNKNGEKIKGSDGEYLKEEINKPKPNFFNEDGTFNQEKFTEYLSQLPPTNKSYIELMKEIQHNEKMREFHAVDKELASMKQDFLKAIEEKDYKKAGNIGLAGLALALKDNHDVGKYIDMAKYETSIAMDNAVQKFLDRKKHGDGDGMLDAICEGIFVAMKQIDNGVGILGITQVKELLKSEYGIRLIDTLTKAGVDDGDDNNLSTAEKSWAAVEGMGKGIEGFIGTQGAAFIGALHIAGEAAASKGLGMIFSATTQAYFGFEGAKSVVEGSIALNDADTEEEAFAAGEAIGVGGFMLHGTVKTAIKAVPEMTKGKSGTGFSWSEPKMVKRYLEMRAERVKIGFNTGIDLASKTVQAFHETKLTKYEEQILQRIAANDELYNYRYSGYYTEEMTINKKISKVKIDNEHQAKIINMILDNPEYYTNPDVMNFAIKNLYAIKYPSQVKMFEKVLTTIELEQFNSSQKAYLVSPFFQTDKQANSAIELLDKILYDERLKDNQALRERIPRIFNCVIRSETDKNVFQYKLDLLNKILENEDLCRDNNFMEEILPSFIECTKDYSQYQIAKKILDTPKLRENPDSARIIFHVGLNNQGFAELLLDKGIDPRDIALICEKVKEIDFDFGKRVSELPEFLKKPEMFVDVLQNYQKDRELTEKLLFDKDYLDFPKKYVGAILENLREENKNITRLLCLDKTLNFPKEYIWDAISGVADKTTEKKYISLLQNPEIAKFVTENYAKYNSDGRHFLTFSDAMFLAKTKRTLISEQKAKPQTETKTKGYSEEQKNSAEVFTDLGLNEKETNAIIQAISKDGLIDIILQTKAVELINSGVPKNKVGELLNSANITGEFNQKIIDDSRAIEGVVNPFLQKHLAILNNLKKTDFVTSDKVIKEYQSQKKTIKTMIEKLDEKTKEELKARGIDLDAITERLEVQMTSAKVKSKRVEVPKGFRTSKDKLTDFEKIVVDKYEPAEEVWRYEDRTKAWAEDKYQDMKQYDYRSEAFPDANKDRVRILNEWFDFMDKDSQIKENPFIKVLITDFITKDLTPETAWLPPAFDRKLAKEVLNKAIENPTEMSFSSYSDKLKEKAKEHFGGDFVDMDGIKGRWYTVPQTDKSSKYFKENVERVQTFSDGTNWCIKTYNADPYIQKGNIHFFVDEHGLTQVCIREQGKKNIYEIQQRQQNGKVPIPYVKIIQDFIGKNKLKANNVIRELREAQDAKVDYDKIKTELQMMQANGDYLGILKYLNIDVKVREDGTYVLSHYSGMVPRVVMDKNGFVDFRYDDGFDPFYLNDFGIREDLLLQNVSEILHGADFKNSNATALPKLEYFGKTEQVKVPGTWNVRAEREGVINYEDSKIVDLRSLKEFRGAKVDFGE